VCVNVCKSLKSALRQYLVCGWNDCVSNSYRSSYKRIHYWVCSGTVLGSGCDHKLPNHYASAKHIKLGLIHNPRIVATGENYEIKIRENTSNSCCRTRKRLTFRVFVQNTFQPVIALPNQLLNHPTSDANHQGRQPWQASPHHPPPFLS